MSQRHAARRRDRKTPLTPSQRGRKRQAKPKRSPGDRYDTRSYYHAVLYGIRRANREAEKSGNTTVDREYITSGFRQLCYPNQHEDEFIEWYLAETAGKTGGFTPATNWLWTHGVYPTNLKVMIHSAQHPPGNWHDVEYDNPLPPFKPAWVDKDEFNERLMKFLRAYPELKADPTALPNYAPEGYEEKRTAWLRSIPTPPALDSFPTPRRPS
jgi:hypothetical protein